MTRQDLRVPDDRRCSSAAWPASPGACRAPGLDSVRIGQSAGEPSL